MIRRPQRNFAKANKRRKLLGMPRLTNARRREISAQVAAGRPCPLCRVAIRPEEEAPLGMGLSRCPHCFRTFQVPQGTGASSIAQPGYAAGTPGAQEAGYPITRTPTPWEKMPPRSERG